MIKHLRLATLLLPWIEVTCFESSEPKLCRRSSVAVRSTEHNLDSQVLDAASCLVTAVVRGTVHLEDDAVAPTRSKLLCHGLRQV